MDRKAPGLRVGSRKHMMVLPGSPSTRISHNIAHRALKCLVDEEYHDLKVLESSSWQARTEKVATRTIANEQQPFLVTCQS